MTVTSIIIMTVTSIIIMTVTSTIITMVTSIITMMETSTTTAHNQWLLQLCQSHLWLQHCQSRIRQAPRRPSPVPWNVDGTPVAGTSAKEIGGNCASIARRWRRSWCAIRSVSMTTCATRIALVQKCHGSKKRWRHRWAATMSVVMTASATTSANVPFAEMKEKCVSRWQLAMIAKTLQTQFGTT